MNFYPLRQQILSMVFIFLLFQFNPLIAFESRDYIVIDMLVNNCFKNTESCNLALLKIHNYQKNAVKNKKFSCQTRLLGLEANLIMAMNFNLPRKDTYSIIKSVKKYC